MRPKAIFAILGALASVALAAGLTGPELAKADREDSAVARAGDAVGDGGVVRAGNAVVDEDGARIEGGPSVDGEEGGSGDEAAGEEEEGAPAEDGEAVLKIRGDEGVEFSGTCSVGGEERELKGQVPEEFTFVLDGDELECEISKEGGDGTLQVVLVSGDDRIAQRVTGDSTTKLTYSGNGVSSSSTSSSSSSNNVVTQSSSSSVVQSSSSSSTGD